MTASLGALAASAIPRPPPWLSWLSACLPLAYYLAAASPHAYWYEESALTGAMAELGVSYPPGTPLGSLLASLLGLFPVGSLAFRAAVASGVWCALTLALFARASFASLMGLGVRDQTLAATLALAAALTLGQSPGFFLCATRPNVYALQALLSLIVLEALVRFELTEPEHDVRILNFAAFAQGLCFANHHVFALFTLAAGAPTLGRVFARRGFAGLMGHSAALLLGFSAYVYVPIRAAQDLTVNFGEGGSLARRLAVLFQDPFWGPRGGQVVPVYERLTSAFSSRSLTLLLVILAAFGLWSLRRAPGRRRFAVLWSIYLAVSFASVSLLLVPSTEADAWGALFPVEVALLALAVMGIGLALERLTANGAPLGRGLWLVRAFVGLALAGFVFGAPARGLSRFEAGDAVDDLARRRLPAHAVLFTRDMSTVFRHLGGEAEERVRPDVTVVPLALLGRASWVDSLARRTPELRPILRELVVRGELELSSLQSLAAERPVLIELDAALLERLHGALITEGWLSRVLPDGVTPLDTKVAAAQALARVRGLRARLRSPLGSPELARRLRSHLFLQALQSASTGDVKTAREMLSLAPEGPDEHVDKLSAWLLRAPEGPIDLSAFSGFE